MDEVLDDVWSDQDRARRTQIREPSARLTGHLDDLSDGIDGYLGMFAFVEKLRMGCAQNHAMNTACRQFAEFPVHLGPDSPGGVIRDSCANDHQGR